MAHPPFSLLVKPASADCNVHCSYCFYLEKAALYPESPRHRMSDQTLERMIERYLTTSQPTYSFGWQGGEPTLMGLPFFERVVELQERWGRRGMSVANGLQTNGITLDGPLSRHFARYRFLIGISIDGPPEVHDANRIYRNGRGTHAQVLQGLSTLRANAVEHNVLTVVSAANWDKAAQVYGYLKELGVDYHQYIPCVEFGPDGKLLPHAITADQWGTFLTDLFDCWHGSGDYERVSVRHFDSVLTMLVDGVANNCVMSRNCRQYFVVEHNGDVYPCDFYVDSTWRLGNVRLDRFEDLWDHPRFREFGRAKRRWHPDCAACAYLQLCAGDCRRVRRGAPEPVSLSTDHAPLSALCSGWKQFYAATLPEFKRLSDWVRARRTPPNRIGGNISV